MKKLLLVLLAVQISCIANGQWIKQKINNGVDTERFIAFNGYYKNHQLFIEKFAKTDSIFFYMIGENWCEDTVDVEFYFLIEDDYYKISKSCNVIGQDRSVLIFSKDLESSNLWEDFIDCSSLMIIIKQCERRPKKYVFDMTNKIHALKFVDIEYD